MKHLTFDPVILSFARTPFGKYNGALSKIRPDDLLVHALKNTLAKVSVDHNLIDEVIIGAANQAGEDNRNVARMASLLLGLNIKIPGITVNRLCASSLDALIEGSRRIMTGEQNLVLIGGVENMSRAPYVLEKNAPIATFRQVFQELSFPRRRESSEVAPSLDPSLRWGDNFHVNIFDTALGWRFYNEKLSYITPEEKNGDTAERLAKIYDISRLMQDEYALKSHQKAISAFESGFFKDEIVSINNIDRDEGPRVDTSFEKLSTLKPTFSNDGTVTAGNSSPLSDGACGMLISSHEFAFKNSLKPLGRILGFSSAGVDPKIMGIGPVPSTKKLCEKFGFSIKDFSLIEINEAFAVQVLSVIKELDLDIEKVNINGGAIALGHPLGASGLRIAMTLLSALRANNKSLGLATLCVALGQGVSLAIEAI